MNHFDEMTCMQYLDGQLERDRAVELATHMDSCPACRRLLSALEGETGLLRTALTEEDEAVPARLLALPAREATPWAWIASFGLACLGLYFFWTGLVEPWMSNLSDAGFGEGNLLAMLFFGGVFWKGWGDMFNLLQMLAMITLGGLGVALLVRSGKRWTTMAMVMSALVGLLALPPAAAAAEISRGKQSYTLAEGETLNNDLIVMAGTTRIEGTLNGDLIAFGRSVTIEGTVTGDVIAFSERLTVNGRVDGDIRGFANTLNLKGKVGKNVTAFISTVELDSKAEIGGGLTMFSGQAGIDGRIGRDILAFGENFDLNGAVGGNVMMQGARLNIGSRAEIPGKIKFRGRNKPEVADGAKLSGPPEFEELKQRRGADYGSLRFYMKEAVWWGAAFLFGLVVALIAPKFFREAVRSGDRYGPSLGAGLVTLILTPVLACIACFTLVGIPLALGAILLWFIAMYAAQTFLGTWLGNKLMGEPAGTGALLGRMAVGLLVIHVVVNLPYIGGWARLVVILMGMGAMTLAIYKRMQSEEPVAV
jgi:cytoskeletal protein CcmA (bactofilin family)/predicted anti-sigma-YlaC factor YlaD